MTEDQAKQAISNAQARYQEYLRACACRRLYPVQAGDAGNIELHRVTKGHYDPLTLPAMVDLPTWATVRCSEDAKLRSKRKPFLDEDL
jgi:hypothetical protein